MNLLSETSVANNIYDAEPDVVIHLAAYCGGIGKNQKNPARMIHDNAKMAVNLLDMCATHKVKKVITLGSVCAYPKFCEVPFKETDIWEGYPEETNAPYGIAKRLLMELGLAYRKSHGLNVVHLVPVNMYGPHDDFDLETSHVIPSMIRKFCTAVDRQCQPDPLWGDGSPTREFLYVEDCCKAIIRAMEVYDGPEIINIGTGQEITMADLSVKIALACGYTEGSIQWDTTKPNGQPRRCLDVTRARELLGWEYTVGLAEGLDRTIKWYKESRNGN